MADEKAKKVLPPELLEKALVELNEVQSEVREDIQALRERILEEPDFNFRTDDAFLLRFLRARKFDQDRALKLITRYYRQREDYPKLFRKTKEEFKKALDAQIVGALPTRDSEGRAIIFMIADRWIPSEIPMEDVMLVFYTTLEVLLEDEAVQINGAVIITELNKFSVTQAMSMPPWKIREAITVNINAFPMRVKRIHGVNESPIFDGIYTIARFFMSKKLRERLTFHGHSLESLHEYASPNVVPEELGGSLGPVDYSDWNKLLLQKYLSMREDDYKYGFI